MRSQMISTWHQRQPPFTKKNPRKHSTQRIILLQRHWLPLMGSPRTDPLPQRQREGKTRPGKTGVRALERTNKYIWKRELLWEMMQRRKSQVRKLKWLFGCSLLTLKALPPIHTHIHASTCTTSASRQQRRPSCKETTIKLWKTWAEIYRERLRGSLERRNDSGSALWGFSELPVRLWQACLFPPAKSLICSTVACLWGQQIFMAWLILEEAGCF